MEKVNKRMAGWEVVGQASRVHLRSCSVHEGRRIRSCRGRMLLPYGWVPDSSLPLLICRQDKKALEILPNNLLVQLFYSERMPTYFKYGKMLLLF